MDKSENLGSFLKENKKLVKDYFDTRLEIYKLKLIRIFSKSAGYFIWIIISLFLLSLFIIFLGLVAGFWLSNVTGSYTIGFVIVTLVIFVKIILLTLWRKVLFVNPIIRAIIKTAGEETETENKE
jgi:hypothetical protein